MARLFFLGDSLVAGKWDSAGGWAGRIASQIMTENVSRAERGEKFECLPYNLGVHGNFVADVTARMTNEITVRTPQKELTGRKIQIICAVGVKDTLQLDEPRFVNDFQTLLKAALSFTPHIKVIGLLPVDEQKLGSFGGSPYKNTTITEYDRTISKTCLDSGVPFFSLFEQIVSNRNYIHSLVDGLHPNAFGHALLAQIITSFICDEEFYAIHTD